MEDQPLDPKYYVSSGKLNLVGYFSGADLAACCFMVRAIESGRVSELGPTIALGQRGFESPILEMNTSIIRDYTEKNFMRGGRED